MVGMIVLDFSIYWNFLEFLEEDSAIENSC